MMGEYDPNYDPNAERDPYARDSEYHAKSHAIVHQGQTPGRDPIPGAQTLRNDVDTLYPTHAFLGPRHAKTTTGDPVRGDIITAQGATPLWTKLARSVPAVNGRNVLGLDNGDTESGWKTALDATLPVVVTPGGAGAAGTSLVFAHRDHDHPAGDVASAATLSAFIALEYTNAVLTAQNLTPTGTTQTNVTNMIVPLLANQVWRFSMTLIYNSAATPKFQWQFTVPAGAVVRFAAPGFLDNAGASANLYNVGATTAAGAQGTAADIYLEMQGTVVCGGTAGNLQLQAAQIVADVGSTTIRPGSNVFARRVA